MTKLIEVLISNTNVLIGVLSGCFVTIFFLLIGFLQRGTQMYNKDFTIHYIEKMNDILKKELSETNQRKMEYDYSLNITKQKLIEKNLFLDELTKANDTMNTAAQFREDMLRKNCDKLLHKEQEIEYMSNDLIKYFDRDVLQKLKIKALNEQIRYWKIKSVHFGRELKDISYYRERTQIAESFISTNGLKKAFDAYLELKSNVNKRRG